MSDTDYNNLCHQLKETLILRYEPIAIKMIKREEDIPQIAIQPIKDLNMHMALCQAFSLTRRDKKTIYMDKNSEWCWNPLICMGYIDCSEGTDSFDRVSRILGITDPAQAKEFLAGFPKLPYGKYIGLVSAPLSSCDFPPDLVLIYANPAQIRVSLGAIKHMTGKIVTTQLDAIDSCAYSCAQTLIDGEYHVTFPDPGEYERALADENEVILSVPGHRLEELVEGLRFFSDIDMGYTGLTKEMLLNFPRPSFYNELFQMWGLGQGALWDKPYAEQNTTEE